jgi:hypothetical protein
MTKASFGKSEAFLFREFPPCGGGIEIVSRSSVRRVDIAEIYDEAD